MPLIVKAPRLGVSASRTIVVPAGMTTAAPATGADPPHVAISAQLFELDTLMVLAGACARTVTGPTPGETRLLKVSYVVPMKFCTDEIAVFAILAA